jgi:hypothetical protein
MNGSEQEGITGLRSLNRSRVQTEPRIRLLKPLADGNRSGHVALQMGEMGATVNSRSLIEVRSDTHREATKGSRQRDLGER